MKNFRVYCAIVGGGAAALMCGCVAASKNKNKKIVIIERDNRVGKKILVSGNARCNLSNINASAKNYHGSFESGVNFLLENYPPQKVLEYFEAIGLVTTTDSEGRVYPLSRQSSAVLSVLRNELSRQNVEELCDTTVNSITKTNNGFELLCDNAKIYAEKVVIATGGKNNYAQKVIGDTHSLLKKAGHTITVTTPSLSPVKVKSEYIKSLKGIRALGSVTAVVNGKDIKTEHGEIQFTADALSGICVFNLSRILNSCDNGKIRLNLLSDYSFEEIKKMLDNRIHLVGNGNIQTIFDGLFHKNIGIFLLKYSGIDINKSADKLTNAEIDKLSKALCCVTFDTIRSNNYSCAQVTSGGVCGSQIDPHTMQSKIVKNMYICGEAIDTDGDCGGYNLQFAFSSGMCAGENI